MKKLLFLLLLPLVAFTAAHKFYVSVTNINYSEKDDALQITSRIFIDDMDALLKERYDISSKLATKNESPLAADYIEKYIRGKFVVSINGKVVPYNYLGKEYDNDVMICYIEIPKVNYKNIKTIAVENDVLTDIYEEQQNVVHLKLKDKKKSFVLIKDNNKGMLNL